MLLLFWTSLPYQRLVKTELEATEFKQQVWGLRAMLVDINSLWYLCVDMTIRTYTNP